MHTLNTKYKSNSDYNAIIKQLEKQGAAIDGEAGTISKKGYVPHKEEQMPFEKGQSVADAIEESAEAVEEMGNEEAREATELIAIPAAIPEKQAMHIADRMRQKKVFGIIGKEETVKEMMLKYRTVWKVTVQEYNKRSEFQYADCYVDSATGEFLHYKNSEFIQSKGLQKVFGLNEEEAMTLAEIASKRAVGEESEKRFKKVVQKLIEKDIVGVQEKNGVRKYFLKKDFDLPPTPSHELLSSISKMRFTTVPSAQKEPEHYSKDSVVKAIQKIWPNVLVKSVSEVNRPLYEAKLEKQGSERKIRIDAVTGKPM